MGEFKLKHNRIGVLTSGGDCAGLNAAIRAITYRAIQDYGFSVVGILASTAGLLERPVRYRELTLDNIGSALLREGGTVLETVNKGNPFEYPMADGSIKDRSDEAIEGFRALNLDALIGIGGDGSARILSALAAKGNIPFVGVPKTIDNDLAETDFAIGYMSAVEVAVDAADRLQPTAASHRRTMVLEVMGRDVGWIAIATGIASGADVILVPEVPFSIDKVIAHLRSRHARGQNHALVVCSEGVRMAEGSTVSHAHSDGEIRYGGVGALIADLIARGTGAETRVTVLGHVQRGGAPCAFDRILASSLGSRAVDLIAQGKTNRYVVWRDGRAEDVALEEVAGKTRGLKEDGMMIGTARHLGICLGD
ncbi:MAG: ATP-dependent 6-phosphofructokinase [Rhodospirillales bacterium]|nr:ATP-dependent 6-phosphofructokinase [Rhodospirillales bacterium]